MKRRPWMPTTEAANVLRQRGLDPVEALSALIRETGHSGMNRLWALGNAVTIRNGATFWLSSPEIDIDLGTIIVPQRVLGRRTPEDRPEPLLINPHELDRRWPDPARPSARKGGGRPSKVDDGALEDAFRLKVIEEGGVPGPDQGPKWQKLSDAEKWVEQWLLDVGTPLKESAIRDRVRNLIANLNAEVGN